MSKSRNGWEMLPGQEVMRTKGFDICTRDDEKCSRERIVINEGLRLRNKLGFFVEERK